MKTIMMSIGCAGSGKTFWARELLKKEPKHWRRVSRDDIRALIADDSVWYDGNTDAEMMVSRIQEQMIRAMINDGFSVIVDNTNCNPRTRKQLHKLAESIGDILVIEKVFKTDLEECIRRNEQRVGRAKVPVKVIEKMYGQVKELVDREVYYAPVGSEDVVEERIADNSHLVKGAIFDLDGSLCEISHRSPYDTAKCLNDKPVKYVVEMAKLLSQNGHHIIMVSGREDKFRDLTEEWLAKYVGVEHSLYMRPTGNFKNDALIKEEIYNQFIKDKYDIRAVVDDRLRVCRAWYKLGLPLFRVGNPDADF